MSVSNDWQLDYTGASSGTVPVLQHIDGRVNYDALTGNAPSLGDYIIFASGVTAKVIGGDDLGGTTLTGYLDLTNVSGLIEDNDTFEVLSTLGFDTVTNGGFVIGDVITGPTTESITVRAIEYNMTTTQGAGTIYGDTVTAGFLNNDALSNDAGVTTVSLATGVEVDNSGVVTTGQTAGQLAPPGTAGTNNAVIIHYDGGTIDIPHEAVIADATTGAIGKNQRLYGDTTTGSIYVVDSDTTGGAWTDNNVLNINDVVFYDTLVSGKVWAVGDVLRGATSLVEGRVIGIIVDTSTTGKLILAGKSGTFTNLENLDRLLPDDTYENVAAVANLTAVLAAAALNIPAATPLIDTQRASEGGIYGSGSLNIVRDTVEMYSYVKGVMDDALQLDDKQSLDGQVKNVAYTVLDPWKVPHQSWRYCMNGGVQDEAANNVLVNIQSAGSMYGVGNHGFITDATNPTPQPDLYIEQDSTVIPQSWLKGHVNVLVLKKTNRDPQYIDGTVDGLGQLIDSGDISVHSREFLRTYASADNSTTNATVAPVFLQTIDDPGNTTGQYRFAYTTGSGSFTEGEEITTGSGNTQKVAIVTADSGTTSGNVDYVLKTGVDFVATDVVVGEVSGKSGTLTGTVTNLVAGYGTDVKIMTVQRRFTGGTTTVASYILGETITQTGTGATGYFMEDDSGTIYIEEEDISTPFNGTGLLTGGTSGALNTPTGTATFLTAPKDIGDGVDNNYVSVGTANLTNGSAQTTTVCYEWTKFLDRKESTIGIAGIGTGATDTQGRFFRKFKSTYGTANNCPHGSFAAPKIFAAQGLFWEKGTLAPANLQDIQLTDDVGAIEDPPNVQSISMTGLSAGMGAGIFRATGAAGGGSTDILSTEFTIAAGNVAANSTIVLAAGTRSVSPTPSDVPDSGVLKCEDPALPLNFLSFPYSSVVRSTNTYTLTSGTIGDVTGALDLISTEDAFVAFNLETAAGSSVSNSVEYVSDFPIVGIARIKGKKANSFAGDFTSSGGAIGAVFSTDPAVNLP